MDNSQSQVSELGGKLVFSQSDGFTVDLQGIDVAIPESSISVTANMPSANQQFTYETGKLNAKVSQTNAAIAGAILTRVGYQVSMTGRVSGEPQLEWSDHFGQLDAKLGELDYRRAMIVAPQYLGKDQLSNL